MSKAPLFKAFNLALIQLGGIGADKSANLKHAQEMIFKAAAGEQGSKPKPDMIVLPVRARAKFYSYI
jgi:omega-amidase